MKAALEQIKAKGEKLVLEKTQLAGKTAENKPKKEKTVPEKREASKGKKPSETNNKITIIPPKPDTKSYLPLLIREN